MRFPTSLRAAVAALALLAGVAQPALAQPDQARKDEEVTGFRFQILTGDDSEVTRRIAEDLYKRLVPTFAGFRTELGQQRRMLYVAIGPAALRDAVARDRKSVV